MTPTRELAEQVAHSLTIFGAFKHLSIVPVYGGVPIERQIRSLQSADIVVGTPGRIIDHLDRRTIRMDEITTVVLDEADRMLDMGFINDVDKILKVCPTPRQTLLFSATISADIEHLSKKYMHEPVEVSVIKYVDASKLSQVYYDISDGLKFSVLLHFLQEEHSGLVMVFCNTRTTANFVANNLMKWGIDTITIHGGLTQDKRLKVLDQFHAQTVKVLVCTDVAARGLHISNVSHVYNYDTPKDAKEYIHRIGRTARAGADGKVVNLITSRDYEFFSNVLQHHSFEIVREELPYIKKVPFRWFESIRGHDDRRGNSRSRDRSSQNRRRR